MAALIDMSNDRANIAFTGETPWHGLGVQMGDNQNLDEWRVAAGLDWTAKRADLQYADDEGNLHASDNQVLYRSDTKKQLGVVTGKYKILQPKDVIEFFSDIVGTQGWKIDVAGSLDDGKRIWALAKTDAEFVVGRGLDTVSTYLMLASSYDAKMATYAGFSNIRTVCNNTMTATLGEWAKNKKARVAVPHSREFNHEKVKQELGIYAAAAETFREQANKLAERKISDAEAMRFILDVLAGKDSKAEDLSTRQSNIVKGVFSLYNGNGMGASYESAAGTLWGALNSVTEYVDHHINTRTSNNRLSSAWFGAGEKMKNDAFGLALELCD